MSKQKKIENWHKKMLSAESELAEFQRCIGEQNAITNLIDSLMTSYTEAIAESVGDTSETLFWYWLENDLGRAGFKAGLRDHMREIRSTSDLIWLLEVTN